MRAVMALLFTVGTVLLAVPADAGLRAVYIDIAKSRQLQIDVADNGDARIGEVGSDGYGLVLGGDFYVVDMDEGRATVARLRDIAQWVDVYRNLWEERFERLDAFLQSTRPPAGKGKKNVHE